MTVYQGLDVLEVEPNWYDDQSRTYKRILDVLDNGMAPAQVNDYTGRSFGGFSFQWWCGSRAEAAALRAFLDARRGRLVPFWMPSWIQDMRLAQAAGSGDSGIVITARAYGDKVFPDLARRDIAIISGSSMVYRRVTSVSQTATTETLTLDSPLPAAVSTGALVSLLHLCRLDTDEPEISWETDSHAVANLPVALIPKEVP